MKKGFTLIELLAVIVILAIIALIAVPVIFNIIETSRESANKESVRNYIRAIDNSILLNDASDSSINITDKAYQVMNDGNICIGTLNSTTCTGSVLVVTVDGKKPKSGSITIQSGKVVSVTNLQFDSFSANWSNGDITINTSDSSPYEQVFKPDYYYFIDDSGETVHVGDNLSDYNIYSSLPSSSEDYYGFYAGIDSDDGKTISRIYACFNKDGREYCLMGADPTLNETNKKILTDAFGESACQRGTNDYDSYNCEFDDFRFRLAIKKGGGFESYWGRACYLSSDYFGCDC